jgi:putative serine/threonine protein kinase
VISIRKIKESNCCKILCYPKCEQKELEKRLEELKKLGVKSLEFTGERIVGGIPVLGKGYVGIVVKAYTNFGRAALKIRRIDANRDGMFHEAEMLKKANTNYVGPKLFEVSQNFLLMELIEGLHLPEWLNSLDIKRTQEQIRSVLTQILEQCYRLDETGLDHGELSKAPKHIIVDVNNIPHLIDFETSSTKRKVSNVTSVCQYLFLGNQITKIIKEKIGIIDEKKFVTALRTYKHENSRDNFERILKILF